MYGLLTAKGVANLQTNPAYYMGLLWSVDMFMVSTEQSHVFVRLG